MKKKNIVEISKSQQMESASKDNFKALIHSKGMYMPFEWASRDNGIDGQVEITKPIEDSESLMPESKFFMVQLKASEKIKVGKTSFSFPVQVKKILQWHAANLPVMLAINDVPRETFYYLWIDELLISALDNISPQWVNQGKVNLKIPTGNKLECYSSEAIREYVLNWKAPARGIVQPGIYFELKDKCHSLLKMFEDITIPFGFVSVGKSLALLFVQLEQAIYRVVITGPSRVGKSSLVNVLLRSPDISPIGIFQTTGVPIQFLPGNKNEIRITFNNGKTIIEEFSKKAIENYASQAGNEDNKKGVSLVTVYLVNRQLENGVCLFDIPGLDDPDDNIYNYTWSTVTKANAILYLIDASPFENGGYIFKREYKKHIHDLGQSLDKIFLVYTKINALTGNKKELLKERVINDLRKYNLYDKVSEKIYFVSAEESLHSRLKKDKGNDTVQILEDDLWKFLLKENKVGLVNLNNVNNSLLNSIADFQSILRARLLDNDSRKKLEEAIHLVNLKIPELSDIYHKREQEIKKTIQAGIENKKYQLLRDLENHLNTFPVDTPLPDKKEIQRYLIQGANQTLNEINTEYIHQINLLAELIDNWIRENLRQVREIISGGKDQKIVDFSDLERFEPPDVDLSNSVGIGILTGILTYLFMPPAAIISGLAAVFFSLLLTAEQRQANRIKKIMQAARNTYDTQFEKIKLAYMEGIKDNSIIITEHVNKKIVSFFNDLQAQINKLDVNLSQAEEKQYKSAFGKIEILLGEIKKLESEIGALCLPR